MALVELAEAQAHLGRGETGGVVVVGTDDNVLATLVAAASARMQHDDLAGPVEITENITELHDGDGPILDLYRPPVHAIVSVTEYRTGGTGTVLPAATPASQVDGYTLDADTGELVRVRRGYPRVWEPGWRNIEVVYTAGRDAVPAEVKLATLELIAHWHRLRKGGSATYMPTGEGAFVGNGGMGYGVPNRVKHLLGRYLRPPVIG